MDPFRGYIGKSARIRDRMYVIESYRVVGRALEFIAVSRDDGSRLKLSVLEMLRSVEATEAA